MWIDSRNIDAMIYIRCPNCHKDTYKIPMAYNITNGDILTCQHCQTSLHIVVETTKSFIDRNRQKKKEREVENI